MDDDRIYVGTREAAALARLSEQTIRNYADQGKIRSSRNPLNGRRDIKRVDAEELRRR